MTRFCCAISRLIFGTVLAALLGQPALAHRPYTVEQKTLTFSDGRSATLELLFGDGIFFADPGRGQLKDEKGAVVAWTPAADGVISYCPSIDHCWVFLFSSRTPVAPWLLKPDAINWAAPVEPPIFPEADDRPPQGFTENHTSWAFLLGITILLVRFSPGLTAMFVPYAGMIFLERLVGSERPSGTRFVLIVLWLVLGLYELLAACFMGELLAFPWIMLVAALGCAALLLHLGLLHFRPKAGLSSSIAAAP
jgi:hypothetical protein